MTQETTTKHDSQELDADAAKLAAMGTDPGMTIDDLDEWIDCWNCGGDGRVVDDDPFWPTDEECEICEGHGGWERPEEVGEPHE